ncbi:hypothetical protein ABEF95_003185 [Exophiala dermatitidis]
MITSLQFEELAPFMFGKEKDKHPGFEFDQLGQKLRALKRFYPIRANRNYPFRSLSTTDLWTKGHVRSIVPHRDVADRYIQNYLDTFEKTHRMLHIPSLREEINLFWRTPTALGYEWLSQFLMMLALGCPRSQRLAHPQMVNLFLEGAEACLMQTQFLAKPTLTSIRVMVMMTLAKQIDMVAFDDSGGVWAYLGLVVRLAMSMGLHRHSRWFVSMSPFEAEMRKRVWVTLVFMDLQNSLEAGQSPLLHPDDYETLCPTGFQDEDMPAPLEDENTPRPESDEAHVHHHHGMVANESTFQTFLDSSLQSILRINRLVHHHHHQSPNEPDDTIYARVVDADVQIQEMRQTASRLYPSHWHTGTLTRVAACNDDDDDDNHNQFSGENKNGKTFLSTDLQGILLEIYFCRLRLALHQPYFMAMAGSDSLAQGSEASATPTKRYRYPDSCRSVLESALSILVLQRTLYDETQTQTQTAVTDSAPDPDGPISIEWFAELFKGDFFVAALFVAIGIRRSSFGVDLNQHHHQHSPDSHHGPPAAVAAAASIAADEINIASRTLDACWHIWASKVGISVHHFKAHLVLGIVIAATKAKLSSCRAEEEINVQRAAVETTIATVEKAMSRSPCSHSYSRNNAVGSRQTTQQSHLMDLDSNKSDYYYLAASGGEQVNGFVQPQPQHEPNSATAVTTDTETELMTSTSTACATHFVGGIGEDSMGQSSYLMPGEFDMSGPGPWPFLSGSFDDDCLFEQFGI